VDGEEALHRAEIASRLAYDNLARLGSSCEDSYREHAKLVRERDIAIVGVARWGYSHRALAVAARVTPQRVTQILAEFSRANPASAPAGVVRSRGKPSPPRSRSQADE